MRNGVGMRITLPNTIDTLVQHTLIQYTLIQYILIQHTLIQANDLIVIDVLPIIDTANQYLQAPARSSKTLLGWSGHLPWVQKKVKNALNYDQELSLGPGMSSTSWNSIITDASLDSHETQSVIMRSLSFRKQPGSSTSSNDLIRCEQMSLICFS